MYATRVTFVTEAMGATNINDGEPTIVHNVLVSSTTSGIDQSFFESGVPLNSSITTRTGEMAIANNASTEWNPYMIFDKGFRVGAPSAGVFVTVTWRPCG